MITFQCSTIEDPDGISHFKGPKTMSNSEIIKPDLNAEDAVTLATKLYGLTAKDLPKEFNSYDDRNYYVLTESGHELGYTLKVVNSLDSKNVEFFKAQTEVLLRLQQKGISTPIVVKNVHGSYMTIETLGKDRKNHVVLMLEFLPGDILKSIATNENLYFEVGVWAAKLGNALLEFQHPGLNRYSIWHLKSLPDVKNYVKYVSDPEKQTLVCQVISDFIDNVVPMVNQLPSGIIHGDLNEQNILVSSSENGWHVSSILDFGDLNVACYVFEIAAAIAYMMMDSLRCSLDFLKCGGATLAGYQTLRPLTSLEVQILKVCVCGRITQSLVLGLYTQSLQPDNQYVGDTQSTGWRVLSELWNTSDKELSSLWNLSQ